MKITKKEVQNLVFFNMLMGKNRFMTTFASFAALKNTLPDNRVSFNDR